MWEMIIIENKRKMNRYISACLKMQNPLMFIIRSHALRDFCMVLEHRFCHGNLVFVSGKFLNCLIF